jgi:hypothetical protein
MDLLCNDTRRDDLAWLLGIDKDILDPDVRLREIANWVDQPVMLHHLAKH